MKSAFVTLSFCLFYALNASTQIIWYENFSLPNGTTIDNGVTAWSIDLAFDCSGSVTGSFDVQAGQFVGNETDCNARWLSEWVDVSSYSSVDIYAVLDGAGSLDAGGGLPDTNKVGYRTDPSSSVTWLDEYAGAQVVNSISCGGAAIGADSVQIVVQMASTGGDEFHYLDDVTIAVSNDLPTGGGDTLFSRQNGDWDQTTSWSTTQGGASCGCIPDSNSVVYVLCGDEILIDADANAKELHIEFGGRVAWDDGNDPLFISSNGIVEVSVGSYLWEAGQTGANLVYEGGGNCTLAVYSEDIGLEIDILQVTGNCTLTVMGNGRIDIEDDFELIANNSVVINQFTNEIYIADDLDMLGDGVVFHNDSGSLYIDGTLEILGENTELINRDSIYVDLDFHGDNADGGTFENYGYIHCNDDVLMSDNSDSYRIDNYGVFRIDDDLRESGTDVVSCQFHNRSNGYLFLGHDNVERDWQLWADYDSNTVDYFRNGLQPYLFTPEDAYWNLTLSNTGFKQTLEDQDVNGSVRIEGTAILDINLNANDLTVAGNWINTSTALLPFETGNQQVTFDGNSRQRIRSSESSLIFHDVIINKSDSLVLQSETEISANGSITFTSGYISCDSVNRLTLNDGVTVSGASDASFVDGRIEKVGNDTFTFPLGDVGNYQPVFMSAPVVVTDAFEAQYFFRDPRNNWTYGSTEAGLHHVSTEEYWIINRVTGGSNVSLTLSFDANSGGVDDLDSLLVARWDGSQWANEGNGGTTGNTAAGTVASGGPIANFSPFTFGSSTEDFGVNPLPVELISFAGSRRDKYVHLTWKTATEVNNDYFEVERSSPSSLNEWQLMDRVQGNGNSSSPHDYELADESAPDSEVYYRLRQVDFDGSVTFSEQVRVAEIELFDEVSERWLIYPNPVSTKRELNILYTGIDEAKHKIELLDLNGNTFYEGTLETRSSVPVSVRLPSGLKSGVYLLRISDSVHLHNTRLIFQ